MLAPRVFTATTFDRKPYNIDFMPTIVDGIECYELKSKDFHYGYMTEALANKIFETRPGSKERYVDSFSFETKVKDNQQTEKYLKDRPFVGISGDGSIHLLYNDCYINGLVQNDQSLEVVAPNPKETYKRYSFFITNSTFKSPVVLSLTKDANSLLVSDTLIDNKGKETALKGDIRILGSELMGDGKKKQAITNSSIRWSKLINFGTIKYSTICNTLLENCKITNRSQGSQDVIIGSSYYSYLDEKDKYEKTDILHVMKNCEIDVSDEFFFNSNIPSRFENCVFKKGYELSNVENNFNLSLINSLFTDARMELEKAPGGSTDFMTIRNCEFTGSSFFCGVKEIDSSIIQNGVKLSNFDKVSDSFLENITKNGGKKVGRELNDFSSSANSKEAGNLKSPISIFPQKDIELL